MWPVTFVGVSAGFPRKSTGVQLHCPKGHWLLLQSASSVPRPQEVNIPLCGRKRERILSVRSEHYHRPPFGVEMSSHLHLGINPTCCYSADARNKTCCQQLHNRRQLRLSWGISGICWSFLKADEMGSGVTSVGVESDQLRHHRSSTYTSQQSSQCKQLLTENFSSFSSVPPDSKLVVWMTTSPEK